MRRMVGGRPAGFSIQAELGGMWWCFRCRRKVVVRSSRAAMKSYPLSWSAVDSLTSDLFYVDPWR